MCQEDSLRTIMLVNKANCVSIEFKFWRYSDGIKVFGLFRLDKGLSVS